MSEGVPVWRRLHEPAIQAALVNGALFLLVPAAWVAYIDYASDVVRPHPATLSSSIVRALPTFLVCVPVATFVAWRSYVHAVAYLSGGATLWRGTLESAAVAAALALAVMFRMTLATWSREPAPMVVAYIAFYVIATAIIGLLLGLALSATALLVLAISPGARRPAA